jgi:hypothetical protein
MLARALIHGPTIDAMHDLSRTEDLISGKFALAKEEWIGVLKLARAWDMQKVSSQGAACFR